MTRALIVDDHAENLYLLSSLLVPNGYEVVTAADGQQALDEAARQRPDIVISDILMPVMDGFALCRRWKQDPRLAQVPFVFYTATYTDPRDEAFAMSLGADLFVVKPTEPADFLRRVGEVLARRAHEPSRAEATPAGDETEYLRGYNEALIRKLEDKVTDLEDANRVLRVRGFAIASATSGIALTNLDGRLTYVNAAFAALLAADAARITGASLDTLFGPRDAVDDLQRTVSAGGPWTGELRTVAGTGPASRTLEGIVDTVRDGEGKPVCRMMAFTDVTNQRRMQEELQRSQRLQSLSLFASGIAHDFNNLLTGLFGNIELARTRLPLDSGAIPYLDNVVLAFERARDLTRRLLTFSRGSLPQRRPCDMALLLRECCSLSLSGSSVRWELVASDVPAFVLGDANQLSQVFTNIIVNARQAVTSGTLRLEVSHRALRSGEVATLPEGTYVQVTLADDGPGIDDAVLARVFNPFFTTKPDGSGLGLAMAYSIVTCHGGHVTATSRPGGGATFTVWLPPAAAPGAEAPVAVPTLARAARPGRVLLMDDEQIIREMAARMLESVGYDVTVVRDGAQAVDVYARALDAGQRFDVVILDVTIPGGLGGREAWTAISRIDPGVAAILSSGYGRELALPDGPKTILPKPYRRHELLGCVAAVISGGRTPRARPVR